LEPIRKFEKTTRHFIFIWNRYNSTQHWIKHPFWQNYKIRWCYFEILKFCGFDDFLTLTYH
jgi:hypothetical protein